MSHPMMKQYQRRANSVQTAGSEEGPADVSWWHIAKSRELRPTKLIKSDDSTTLNRLQDAE
jgi:hypothetical protein